MGALLISVEMKNEETSDFPQYFHLASNALTCKVRSSHFRNATISVAFFEHRVDFPAKLERKSIVIKLRQFHVFIVNLLWRVYPYRTLLTFMIFAFLSWSLCLDIWLICKGKYWPDSTLAGQPN